MNRRRLSHLKSLLKVSYIEPTLTNFFHIVPRNGDCSRQWVKRNPPESQKRPTPMGEGGGCLDTQPPRISKTPPPVPSLDH